MRFVAHVPAALALGSLVLAPLSVQAATSWTASKTSAEGCNSYRDMSVCIVLRCDAPRRLNTYFQVVEGDPFTDRVTFVIDGERFPAKVAVPASHVWGTAYAVRSPPARLMAAMSTGRTLTLRGAILTGGFNVFSLAGADAATGKVRKSCGLPPQP